MRNEKVHYQKAAKGLIKGRVLFDAPLRRFTSIRVGGPADTMLFPSDVRELARVVRFAAKKRIPVLMIGRGTNLIVRDGGFRGWVVNLTHGLKRVQADGETIEAEAGLSLQRLVRFSIRRSLTGLEPFFGIPGTVGGGLAMNAGAWGSELKDVVSAVTFMKEDGEVLSRPRKSLRFFYRGLSIPRCWTILEGRFRLKKGRREEIAERVKSYSEMRRRTQPLEYPSAGSVFKNPAEGPAGKWIEEIGLKGFRIGEAMISDRHANFIINLGKATAHDIITLMDQVEMRMYREKGISLEREVRVIGE